MLHDSTHSDAMPHAAIVAVFDSRIMAQRAVAELAAAEFHDIWLGIVRGENDAGHTTVARDGEPEIALHELLTDRGAPDLDVHRFDGILPPGSAVLSLRAHAKHEAALHIIEMIGGHVDHC
jgi:predicted Zn-dependent protease